MIAGVMSFQNYSYINISSDSNVKYLEMIDNKI